MSPKIPNIIDRKHFLNSLPELFEKLTLPELAAIANTLGLSDIINDGTIIPRYSVDVTSDTDRFLNPEVSYGSIRLYARLYHFLNDVTAELGNFTWSRYVDDTLDTNWSKQGSEIEITQTDLDGILDGQVKFVCTATVENEPEITDFYFFTYTQVLSKVRIVPTVNTFVGGSPSTNVLRLELSGINPTEYRWYVNTDFVSSANTYTLNNSQVPAVGSVVVRVEVEDTKGNEHYDFVTITKVQNGQDGQQGPAGPPGDPGQDGQDGSPGVPGTDAPILRMLEWVNGRSYFNNSQYKDYVYYRPRNKWFKLLDGVPSAVATGDPATQSNTWEETTEVQGSILAENANIGGWIMRNNMLFSQAGLVLDTNGDPISSNIVLNGLTGNIVFGNNRATLNMSGLIFRDALQRPRITGSWNEETGVPRLFFQDENGNITWEAGREYVPWISQGTTQPSWGPAVKVIRFPTLGSNPNVLDESSAANLVQSYLANVPNSNTATILSTSDTPFLVGAAFPLNDSLITDTTNRGAVHLYDKGDIGANQNNHEGYYKVKEVVTTSQLPSSKVATNGWYLLEGLCGAMNGQMLIPRNETQNSAEYHLYFSFLNNGVITETQSVLIFTKYT